eukprot:TRINITY_DN29290_c0_g1_i1.p1 TRINITY_DN29290_c0_g1~~TRINITY_DN29290_c0_g1_i1.p1  ORF type:complete len:685 (+),score=98.90 TRINITY_DN29290_c0_g1_i1:174-2228(+)
MTDSFPIEAVKDTQVRILHRVGLQHCVLTLDVQATDDVYARVLQVFQSGHLPSCLFKPTLDYVSLAIRDSLSDDEQICSQAKAQWTRPLGADIAVAIPKVPSLLPSPLRERTFWYAFDFLLRHRPAFFRTIGTLEESNLKGIRELQGRLRRAISQLQMRQSMEMEQVRQRAEKAALEVDAVQESEAGLSRSVQELVAQHVGELDAVELHWRTEIEELKVRQKASYCDLVVDFFEQEIDQLGAAVEDLDSCLKPLGALSEDSSVMTTGVVPGGSNNGPELAGVTDHGSDRAFQAAIGESRGDLKVRAEVRAVFGQRRVFFVLRLFVGDIMELLPDESMTEQSDEYADVARAVGAGSSGSGGGPSGRYIVATDDDGAGPQLPPELVGLGSYGQRHFVCSSVVGCRPVCPGVSAVSAGFSALPGNAAAVGSVPGQDSGGSGGIAHFAGRATRANTTFRSPSLCFWGPPRLPPPVGLSPNAYADRLRGLVIPTPENLKFEVTQAVMLREFAARCDRVTDLHFRSLAEQLQAVRKSTRATPLKSGDYFCTRHSNLGGTMQAAFHLLTGSSEALAGDEVPAATHRAIRRIVGDCHRCHVAELTLPLLLLDIGTSESSLPYAVAQRRSENALRALKGALTRLAEELAPSELPELQVVNLVLPASSAQSISTGIPSVAESVLIYLRNSFQCV